MRFGSGMKPKKGDWSGYCWSSAGGRPSMIQLHENGLDWGAAFTLAHELGHSFGMCFVGKGPWSKYCTKAHTTYEVGDIMVYDGRPISDIDNGVGRMFNKFQVRCTEANKPGEQKVSAYDSMMCANPGGSRYATKLSCENGGIKNCGKKYYTFKTTPTEAVVAVRDRSSLHYVHCCSGCVSDGTLEVLSAGLSGTKLGPLNDKGCSKLMNFPAARKFCTTARHRLCTVDELKTIQTSSTTTTFNNKCGYADKEVWTRTADDQGEEVNDLNVKCRREVWDGE